MRAVDSLSNTNAKSSITGNTIQANTIAQVAIFEYSGPTYVSMVSSMECSYSYRPANAQEYFNAKWMHKWMHEWMHKWMYNWMHKRMHK